MSLVDTLEMNITEGDAKRINKSIRSEGIITEIWFITKNS